MTADNKNNNEDIGYLKARIESIQKTQDEMYIIIKAMKEDMDEGKGARKALHWVYIVVVAILALKFGDITKLFTGGK